MSKQQIETNRLVLKPANNKEDLAAFKRELVPEEYFFQFGFEYDEHLLDNYDFTNFGVICYSIFRKSDEAYVGYVGIMPDEEEPEIGALEYFIAKAHRNKGYCKEATRALINAFKCGELTGTNGEQLIAETISENEISASLLKSLGFFKESWKIVASFIEDSNDPDNHSTICHGVDRYVLDLNIDHSTQINLTGFISPYEELAACA